MSKIDWQWSAVTAYCVTFVTLGALTGLKIVHPEVLLSMLTWLAPAPWTPKTPAPSYAKLDA